jgi:hypothetical protein
MYNSVWFLCSALVVYVMQVCFSWHIRLDFVPTSPWRRSILCPPLQARSRQRLALLWSASCVRSSVHSAFPFRDINVHRILSYGSCLDRSMEGNMIGKLEQGQKFALAGAEILFDHLSFSPNTSAFILLTFCLPASL